MCALTCLLSVWARSPGPHLRCGSLPGQRVNRQDTEPLQPHLTLWCHPGEDRVRIRQPSGYALWYEMRAKAWEGHIMKHLHPAVLGDEWGASHVNPRRPHPCARSRRNARRANNGGAQFIDTMRQPQAESRDTQLPCVTEPSFPARRTFIPRPWSSCLPGMLRYGCIASRAREHSWEWIPQG